MPWPERPVEMQSHLFGFQKVPIYWDQVYKIQVWSQEKNLAMKKEPSTFPACANSLHATFPYW